MFSRSFFQGVEGQNCVIEDERSGLCNINPLPDDKF